MCSTVSCKALIEKAHSGKLAPHPGTIAPETRFMLPWLTHIQVMHYSRVMPLVGGQRYLTSTAVFMNEVVKLAISLTLALYEQSRTLYPNAPATTLFNNLLGQIFSGDSWKMAIPAVLYTLQNTLQYIAVSNLDAATYQVTYQLKILSVAIFSVLLLGRQLSTIKWLSLVLLMLGVAIVQIPTGSDTVATWQELKDGSTGWSLPRSVEQMRDLGNVAAAQLLVKRSATYEGIEKIEGPLSSQLSASRGLVAALLGCLTSGLAGVLFEKILKDSAIDVSLWVRNVQMSFYSIFPALFVGIMFRDGVEISKSGFFAGYTWIVWLVILLQAIGGLLVSAVVNYANNIAKGFATSISIVLSFIISIAIFDTQFRASVSVRNASSTSVADI